MFQDAISVIHCNLGNYSLIIPKFLLKLQILRIKYSNVLQLHMPAFCNFGIFLAFKWHIQDEREGNDWTNLDI